MDLNSLWYLLNLLEGKVADQYSSITQKTLTRAIAGDKTLIKAIEANAQSTANCPLQQAFSTALEQEPPNDTLEQHSGIKHKRDDLEYDKQNTIS
jgi:hypothetical protein